MADREASGPSPWLTLDSFWQIGLGLLQVMSQLDVILTLKTNNLWYQCSRNFAGESLTIFARHHYITYLAVVFHSSAVKPLV